MDDREDGLRGTDGCDSFFFIWMRRGERAWEKSKHWVYWLTKEGIGMRGSGRGGNY